MLTVKDCEISSRIIKRLRQQQRAIWTEMAIWKERGGDDAVRMLKQQHRAYRVAIEIVKAEFK